MSEPAVLEVFDLWKLNEEIKVLKAIEVERRAEYNAIPATANYLIPSHQKIKARYMKASLNHDTLEPKQHETSWCSWVQSKKKIPTPRSFMKCLGDFENFQVWPEVWAG